MRFIRILIGLSLVSMMVLIGGCADTCTNEPTHIVYVGDNPCGFQSVDGDIVQDLWVFPKDRVILVNTSTKDLKIMFDSEPPNIIFDVTEVLIKPNQKATLTVRADATGSWSYDIEGCTIVPDAILGLPKVVVGEGP